MVIDDDEQIVEALGLILRTAGYEFLWVKNKDHWLDKNKLIKYIQDCEPDLVVLDIKLRLSDGLEITKVLKSDKKTENVPIILMSARMGDYGPEDLEGAEVFLNKPFKMTEFLTTIATLLQSTLAP